MVFAIFVIPILYDRSSSTNVAQLGVTSTFFFLLLERLKAEKKGRKRNRYNRLFKKIPLIER